MGEEIAARQAAAERNRGGGESGATERSKSGSFVTMMGVCNADGSKMVIGAGNTKTEEATNALSGSWQQDMEQAVIPNI
jgi:hypothetical protein